MESIGDCAFQDCINLAALTIVSEVGASVENASDNGGGAPGSKVFSSVGTNAFDGCPALDNITVVGSDAAKSRTILEFGTLVGEDGGYDDSALVTQLSKAGVRSLQRSQR